ncbi:HIT domain-containing protein [Salinimonas sp. HHU 13199]|uniref:HIT domain-containing protein n=1 Tax=Salinimonas profundi TaxID=2729140 RepID=A0ABR8LLJ2_9ALTE|nr:HIT domain-containing protein [Salinimonas profundi]MBD3584929.1 HIT domain-containing protein [Salinimonas profundi]
MFELDSRLQADTELIGDMPLCRALLMNDSQFPWVILVPREPGVRELFELDETKQHQFLKESAMVCRALTTLYLPEKLNVAALGNVVAQLHVHHVARFSDDIAWPSPVWGRQPAVPYTADALQRHKHNLQQYLIKERSSDTDNHPND